MNETVATTSSKKLWKWTPHWHVAQGRGHRVVGFHTEGEVTKVIVGITFRGVESIHVIPSVGTIYSNVDVRRRVAPSLMK